MHPQAAPAVTCACTSPSWTKVPHERSSERAGKPQELVTPDQELTFGEEFKLEAWPLALRRATARSPPTSLLLPSRIARSSHHASNYYRAQTAVASFSGPYTWRGYSLLLLHKSALMIASGFDLGSDVSTPALTTAQSSIMLSRGQVAGRCRYALRIFSTIIAPIMQVSPQPAASES